MWELVRPLEIEETKKRQYLAELLARKNQEQEEDTPKKKASQKKSTDADTYGEFKLGLFS